MSEQPAGWFADPTGRYQHRYWDGRGWTEHVAGYGARSTDPMTPTAPDDSLDPAQVREILTEAAVPAPAAGGGTPFTEPVLVVYQWTSDLTEGYQYSVVAPTGVVVGRIRERVADKPDADEASWGELMNHANTDEFEFVDPAGTPWARLSHKKVWKSKVTVTDPSGGEIGTVEQQNVLGKVKLGMAAAGHQVGRLVSDDTQLLGFTLSDAARNPVGRVVKLGRYSQPGVLGPRKVLGLYVLRLDARPDQPLHTLALAAPLTVDLAFNLNQAGYRSLGREVSGH